MEKVWVCQVYYYHRKYPDTYEYVNSWGAWGFENRGIFRMKADVRRYLVQQLNGDCALPSEIAVVKKTEPTKRAA